MAKDDPQFRLPPHDIDAEMCVIASMMLDSACIPTVRALLGKEAWYQPDHQVIAGVLYTMHSEGKAVDAILLYSELNRLKMLNEVGGKDYIGKILGTVPSAAHCEHYAKVVKEYAMWRELIAISNDALREAYAAKGGQFMAPAADSLAKLSARAIQASAGGRLSEVHDLQSVAVEVAEQLEDTLAGKNPGQFIKTGLRELDDMIGGLRVRGTTIVAGKPGMGKSAGAKQILSNIAAAGIPCGLITVEEDRYKVAANRLASASGVSNHKIAHGKTTAAELVSVCNALPDIPNNFYVVDVARKTTEVVAMAHLLATKYGCKVISVDHLHIIDGEKDRNESREREISKISSTLKTLWKELNVAGLEACQLNRGSGTERPTIANLRDSGSLEADGDVVLLLHREDYYRKKEWKSGDPMPELDGVLEVIVGKNKDGAEGTVKTKFEERTQTISDFNQPDPFA